jgi:hypothetical protein
MKRKLHKLVVLSTLAVVGLLVGEASAQVACEVDDDCGRSGLLGWCATDGTSVFLTVSCGEDGLCYEERSQACPIVRPFICERQDECAPDCFCDLRYPGGAACVNPLAGTFCI